MTETGLPKNKIPIIRVPATPADANTGGSIFGGWIMSQVDIAGSIPAGIRAKGRIVTRAVDSLEFKKPVFIGDLISCYAEVVATGYTSIKVQVDVYAQRISGGKITVTMVTHATLTYVAIDEKGRPRAIDCPAY
jgi:acyl-CoA thioesterase YciA